MKWEAQQQQALKLVSKWLKTPKDKRQQVFRLFGWAGTGKTTLAKEIATYVKGSVLFAAYTGKAAARLKQKGCDPASTLHYLIYKPLIDEETGKILGFTKNWESPLTTCQLLIVDEVSMVNAEMALDLLSFKCPVLVLGDTGQLPPIKGEGFFIQSEPDFLLTEIVRQARDNPIIELATLAREGQPIKPGSYGSSKVLASDRKISDSLLLTASQILVGMNSTRKALNTRYRLLNGKGEEDPVYPVRGDRLICLRNDRDLGLLNGTLWKCNSPKIKPVLKIENYTEYMKGEQPAKWKATKFKGLHLSLKSLDLFDSENKPLIVRDLQISCHLFDNSVEPPYREIAATHQVDFGYAITVHKSQGSEWESVLVVDESSVFRDNRERHLYTAITRASESLVLKL